MTPAGRVPPTEAEGPPSVTSETQTDSMKAVASGCPPTQQTWEEGAGAG